MKCQICARQYLCENFKKIENCSNIIKFSNTKNYGEVKRIEDEMKEDEKNVRKRYRDKVEK